MSVKLFDAVTATGASNEWIVRQRPDKHTVQGTITGAPTAVTVALEGSINNGDNWEELGSYDLTAGDLSSGDFMFHVVDRAVQRVRLNLTTLTAGTSPTVTAWYENSAGYDLD